MVVVISQSKEQKLYEILSYQRCQLINHLYATTILTTLHVSSSRRSSANMGEVSHRLRSKVLRKARKGRSKVCVFLFAR